MRRNSFSQPTRLYAVRFRFYDAVTFRWLNRDPAGYVDSMNLYGYRFGSGIGWSDPFGLTADDPWYGISDPDFRAWVEREGKRGLDRRTLTKSEFFELYEEYNQLGRPLASEARGKGLRAHRDSGNRIRGRLMTAAFAALGVGLAYDAGASIAPELLAAFEHLENTAKYSDAMWIAQEIAILLAQADLAGGAAIEMLRERLLEAWRRYRDEVQSQPGNEHAPIQFHSWELDPQAPSDSPPDSSCEYHYRHSHQSVLPWRRRR